MAARDRRHARVIVGENFKENHQISAIPTFVARFFPPSVSLLFSPLLYFATAPLPRPPYLASRPPQGAMPWRGADQRNLGANKKTDARKLGACLYRGLPSAIFGGKSFHTHIFHTFSSFCVCTRYFSSSFSLLKSARIIVAMRLKLLSGSDVTFLWKSSTGNRAGKSP